MSTEIVTTVFYCQRLTKEEERKRLEAHYGESLHLFPMPCSGRIEVNHLLKALESHSDVAYVVTCPVGQCRYKEGNLRVSKRVDRAKELISSIGLESDRISILRAGEVEFSDLINKIIEEANKIPRSPVHANKR